MPSRKDEKLMLAEQVLEVRHIACGSFLDVRGYVADFVRDSGFLPHWNIDTNVVNFRDKPDKAEKEGAFAGYRSAGYFVYDPPTPNYFCDRAGAFWKIILKNGHYTLPTIERFGARTKVFLPSDKSFEEIYKSVYSALYTDRSKDLFGGTEKDVQFIVELKESDFEVRMSGGPIHTGEAQKYLGFTSEHLSKAGFFVDVDFHRTEKVTNDDIPRLLKTAVELTWAKIERLGAAVGV